MRRALVFPFDLTFDANPRHEHQRPALSEDIKSDAFIKPLLPAYLYLLTVASQVLFKGNIGLGKIPQRVIEATDDFVCVEGAEQVKDIIQQCTEQCNAKDACTKTIFVKFMSNELKTLDITPTVVSKILANIVSFHNTKYGREKVRMIQGGFYLKLKNAIIV